MKASAMTSRSPNTVRRPTWGLRRIVTAAVSVALLPAAVARRHRR
jgi:hypothetical protein